ncbi:MAG: glycosyltransferase [Actinomycetota bacterium]|nr:glycosyltransferase [Actinomycetota bacterium]
MIGSGFSLPFADDAFDLVASHDTFEHLQSGRRLEFTIELLRVSKGPALIVAPFSDPRTARCESLVNSYFASRTGDTVNALDEHVQFGLPALEELVGWAEEQSLECQVFGDGWLYHWLAFYYLKAHLTAEGRIDEMGRLHAALNLDHSLQEADHQPPHYRRSVLLGADELHLDLPASLEEDAIQEGVAEEVESLTELALGLGGVLVRGDDPFDPRSRSRQWMDERADEVGPLGVVARSMTRSLQVAGDRPDDWRPPKVRTARIGQPSVTVVIVNLDGAHHLRDCLDSLGAQDYPKELLEVVVVDNGSTDDSLALLAQHYPWVRVLAQNSNLGFAPAVDLGVRSVATDCVALLNNDMRVEADWVTEMVRLYDPAKGVPCVGGQILSWDGQKVDFAQSALNFTGMGLQIDFDRPRESVEVHDGQDLLFACGGAMLVDRATYLTSGGFDPKFFAYYEDVDFGWRLWLLGFRVRLAARALSYHRHHGTSARFPEHQRVLLLERNALRSMIKNYGADQLSATFGPSLLLLAQRAIIRARLDRLPYDIGEPAEGTEVVERVALAHLHAVADVIDDLPELMEQRGRVQRSRRRSDGEILERFGRPFDSPLPDVSYVEAQQKVVDGFGLDDRFERRVAKRLLILGTETSDGTQPGDLRALALAESLGRTVEVRLAVPSPWKGDTGSLTPDICSAEDELRYLVESSDVVVVQEAEVFARQPSLAGSSAVLVADLSYPCFYQDLRPGHDRRHHQASRDHMAALSRLLDLCDFFVCASERQRDHWLALLSARGRLTDGGYGDDASLRDLVDVVPFSVPERFPQHGQQVLKGVHPRVAEDDLVILWAGGDDPWLDPFTLIEALPSVLEVVPDVKVCFVDWHDSEAEMPPKADLRARVESLGSAASSVIFEQAAPGTADSYLLEADIAVSASRDDARARMGFGARVLEALWAGVPVVVSEGDVLSDAVERERAGLTFLPGDWTGLSRVLIRLLSGPVLRAECSTRGRALASRYQRSRAAAPLQRVVHAPWRWREMRDERRLGRTVTDDVRVLLDRRVQELRLCRNEAAELRCQISDLEVMVKDQRGLLDHQRKRLDLVRKTPAYPIFRAATRARRWAKKLAP